MYDDEEDGYPSSRIPLILAIMALCLCCVAVFMPYPVPDYRITRALNNQGLTEIETEGLAFSECSDKFRTKFVALDDQNRQVKGVICGGWFGHDTIHYIND